MGPPDSLLRGRSPSPACPTLSLKSDSASPAAAVISHLLYFSLFTKIKQGDVCGAGEGACKGLLPTGTQKEERGWGTRGGPPGRVWGSLEWGEMALSPNSTCFIWKAPDPRPAPLELLRPGRGLWKGSHLPDRGPGFLDPLLLLLLPPALGSPWAGVQETTSDPWWRMAPQRIRGAERSLVTVGRSFTVAKGFVPLWGERCG